MQRIGDRRRDGGHGKLADAAGIGIAGDQLDGDVGAIGKPGQIEIALTEHADPTLAGTLSKKLDEWTGARWMIAVARGGGAETIAEVKQNARARMVDDARADPLVTAAFAHFPGAEIVGHGRSNSERQGTLSEAEERALIAETTTAIEKHAGARPRGWLGPWISQSHGTPDLLQEAGYNYLLDWCHDDQPTWMKTRNGRILSVPYPQELNDVPQIVARKREGADFADMIVDAFDVLYAECAKRPLVMGIALHAYIVGQPHLFKHLARALNNIVRRADDKVWFTTTGAIAAHAAALPSGTVA